ncbi:hypothetical protein BZA70DRAFT_291394 [Myxozyma melibiosi]|uniref:C2H2-type domain-containing protein n=1 Tax=Myxozyma melibiosi TaxID=54550 RepID=A0ABR1F0J7_9ASCO
MSDQKSFYGANKPAETGRQTWDKDEMLKQARERAERERHARESRFVREPTPPDAQEIEIRRQRLNLDSDLNKVTLVPAGASAVGKRGRGAGYYCEACNLTFKDSLQWVDHLNSKQHLQATGQTDSVKRATVEDVRSRLRWLRQKREEDLQGQQYDIQKRIAERKRIEEEERQRRREKRNAKRKERRARSASAGGDEVDEERLAMEQMMGIKGFGTTKVN